jgi:hypothetical protein
MANDPFDNKVNEISTDGEKRFSKDAWDASMGGLKRTTGGIQRPAMEQFIATNPDPAGTLHHVGKESLLSEMQRYGGHSDDAARHRATASEQEYERIRQHEREEWRARKGRR